MPVGHTIRLAALLGVLAGPACFFPAQTEVALDDNEASVDRYLRLRAGVVRLHLPDADAQRSGWLVTDTIVATTASIAEDCPRCADDEFTVEFVDGEVRQGRLEEIDERLDLALVLLDRPHLSPLPVSETSPEPDADVSSIGHPKASRGAGVWFGLAGNTSDDCATGPDGFWIDVYVDAGSAGAPVFDDCGRVVGQLTQLEPRVPGQCESYDVDPAGPTIIDFAEAPVQLAHRATAAPAILERVELFQRERDLDAEFSSDVACQSPAGAAVREPDFETIDDEGLTALMSSAMQSVVLIDNQVAGVLVTSDVALVSREALERIGAGDRRIDVDTPSSATLGDVYAPGDLEFPEAFLAVALDDAVDAPALSFAEGSPPTSRVYILGHPPALRGLGQWRVVPGQLDADLDGELFVTAPVDVPGGVVVSANGVVLGLISECPPQSEGPPAEIVEAYAPLRPGCVMRATAAADAAEVLRR